MICPEHKKLLAQVKAVQKAARSDRDRMNRNARPGKNPILGRFNHEIGHRSYVLADIWRQSRPDECAACKVIRLYASATYCKIPDVLATCLASSIG